MNYLPLCFRNNFLNAYPNFNKFSHSSAAASIFDYLCTADAIFKMIEEVKRDEPALCGVVKDIERLANNKNGNELTDDFFKQMIGTMIQFILKEFGYYSTGQRNLRKGVSAFFKSSSLYYIPPVSNPHIYTSSGNIARERPTANYKLVFTPQIMLI